MGWLRRLFGSSRAGAGARVWPPEWVREQLAERVPLAARLTDAQRARLEQLVQRFVAEKRFHSAGDVVISDEMKLIIAAYAALLVVELPEVGLYPRTGEVIVHAGAFGEVVEAVGPDGRRYGIPEYKAGQAVYRGPVLIAWDRVQAALRGYVTGNVIIHEFAHALDFEDGVIDGTPPLPSRARVRRWAEVCTREFDRLRADAAQGRPTVLDPYGTKNPAEFFSVAAEAFFTRAVALRAGHPELYEELRAALKLDPAAWERAAEA